MGKKSKGKEYTSKGERRNVRRDIVNAQRREYRSNLLDVTMNKVAAWKRMKKVWLTKPNPNPNETNKPFVRVLASDEWGDPRRRFIMGQGKEES